jgi:hypothetical protein
MKKLIAIVVGLMLLSGIAHAASDTATSSTSVNILDIFSIEFFDDATAVRYPLGDIAFPAVDPANEETMVFTSAYVLGDLKSDVGVICRTNQNVDWALKTRMSTTSTDLTRTNVAIYKPDLVFDRNTTPATTYSTGVTKQWYLISDTDETLFIGTGGVQNTAPFGVLATFSFAVLPTGQAAPAGQAAIGWGNPLPRGAHDFDIVYTLTTSLT